MLAHDIIIRPLLTEKGYDGIHPADSKKTDRKDYGKKYTFVVAKSANKTTIKLAVEEVFGVKVEKVTTATVKGKLKRQGRTQGHTPDWKKATVSLTSDSKAIVQLTADSKTIEFFDSLS